MHAKLTTTVHVRVPFDTGVHLARLAETEGTDKSRLIRDLLACYVILPEALLREAREMGINLSQAWERGLAAAVADARRQRWLEENHEAMEAWNDDVAEHGLPLAAYRQF